MLTISLGQKGEEKCAAYFSSFPHAIHHLQVTAWAHCGVGCGHLPKRSCTRGPCQAPATLLVPQSPHEGRALLVMPVARVLVKQVNAHLDGAGTQPIPEGGGCQRGNLLLAALGFPSQVDLEGPWRDWVSSGFLQTCLAPGSEVRVPSLSGLF